MDYRFKRDLKNSFMIVDSGFSDLGYEKEILMYNDIDVLVPFHTVSINNEMQIWYDITGLVSLKDYLMQQGITPELMRKVLVYLKIAVDEVQRYLIDVNHLVIDTNTIFVVKNNSEWKLMLIYYPEANSESGLENITRFFMENADEKLMDTCFGLYDAAVEGMGIDGIIKRIDTEKGIDETSEIEGQIYEDEDDKVDDTASNDNNSFMKERCFDASYEGSDIYEEEENMTLFDRIKEVVLNKLKELKQNRKRIRNTEQMEDFEEDFVYEPNQQIYEPTVLLKSVDDLQDESGANSVVGLTGELKYIGDNKREDIRIDKDVFSLGSAKEGNDSVIDSPVISRFHAKIVRENNTYYIEDLNSTNGTLVNGELLRYQEKKELSSDDVVAFADECYRIV